MSTRLFNSPLGFLRVVGFLEGISFLFLIGVAIPLKYIAGLPQAVRILGMAHGLLFVLYVGLVAVISFQLKWPFRKTFLTIVVSLLPFGTFWADKNLFR
ncbi:DUF3817 domain-containing protein [uncultured Hymenobacter sp.]|uniref:DUF3817 domain-containing protein n=1 Tax=uncultured Hymenobacter sp. TaxID=170016 RepID=UPI0035CA9D71